MLMTLPALKHILPHGKLTTKIRSIGVNNSNQRRAGVIQKQVGAAVFFERMAVPNDWANVCLRVMLDAAQEAGVLFEPIRQTNTELQLPSELIFLADKAMLREKRYVWGKSLRLLLRKSCILSENTPIVPLTGILSLMVIYGWILQRERFLSIALVLKVIRRSFFRINQMIAGFVLYGTWMISSD
ncbi:putative type VI secretion protein [Escherichia coli]|uniref:Putative type VI secretion protein n=1 Tax=Escherichia coli TaxID=562 RepID=A0A3S4KXI2_ECOLX|nr:putative type VI secretion protein [Escherichia coli]